MRAWSIRPIKGIFGLTYNYKFYKIISMACICVSLINYLIRHAYKISFVISNCFQIFVSDFLHHETVDTDSRSQNELLPVSSTVAVFKRSRDQGVVYQIISSRIVYNHTICYFLHLYLGLWMSTEIILCKIQKTMP